MRDFLINWSISQPKKVFWLTALLSLAALACIPSISVDTDPENMLPHSHPARVLHDEVKQRFGLSDMVVVGIVNDSHDQGVYNAQTLNNLRSLTSQVLLIDGVIDDDLMSLAKADNIAQGKQGEIVFRWMLNRDLNNDSQASAIKANVDRLPMLRNTLVSDDGKALGLFVPIVAKDQSYRVYQEILAIIETLPKGQDQYHITGLPVAEDTFGVEMFKQMAISAPAAGALIFVMMLFFFRSAPLVTAPMIVAMGTVIITMGLMIGLGFPVHIMSSMIPIFLMPIAVVDSVHILSEFNDHYRPGMDKKQLAKEVVEELFQPMLFTSITSIVGFASLNTADIPPVRVFGSFVAIGIAVAFLLSITLVPAYMSSLSDETLEKMAKRVHSGERPNSFLARILRFLPGLTLANSKLIILLALGSFVLSGYGISKIVINDNPMNWFESEHPIRKADKVLNNHFAGTYEAYLSFDRTVNKASAVDLEQRASGLIAGKGAIAQQWQELIQKHSVNGALDLTALNQAVIDQQFEAEGEAADIWDSLATLLDESSQKQRLFLQPEVLAYLESAQQALMDSGFVGKTTALPDVLKTVNRELLSGEQKDYRLPTTAEANAQAILTFQGSHRPNDVWHLLTPDYQSAVIWLQLKSGDNQDMSKVLDFMQKWMTDNPPPADLKPNWSGLTYINVAWQDAMVSGMLSSLLSSFVIVALMMMLLFRSVVWGLIAMLPLSVTITFIYGLIGLIGKNYDMPVAVLSALTLGMSIDFAIHFIERSRALVKRAGSWRAGIVEVFEEPGRAISRNALVIALGFTPLLIAPLVPYQTVGVFLASIMAISCITSLLVLPSIMNLLRAYLFAEQSK